MNKLAYYICVRKNKNKNLHKKYKLHRYDPYIKDSKTSCIDGVDSTRTANYETIGKYNGMSRNEWLYKVLYRQNPAIKHIYENWDISPEHPGMKIRTNFRSGEFKEYNSYGMIMNTLGWVKNFGGKYFDAPNGEQCLVKTFAPMKLTVGWSKLIKNFLNENLSSVKRRASQFSFHLLGFGRCTGNSTCGMEKQTLAVGQTFLFA